MFFSLELITKIIFLIVIGIFLITLVRGIVTWNKNNNAPQLTVSANVVAKRTNISHHNNRNLVSTSSTRYYVTFQVANGDRMEFKVKGREYGTLVEGDFGKLSYQGSRFLNFERAII